MEISPIRSGWRNGSPFSHESKFPVTQKFHVPLSFLSYFFFLLFIFSIAFNLLFYCIQPFRSFIFSIAFNLFFYCIQPFPPFLFSIAFNLFFYCIQPFPPFIFSIAFNLFFYCAQASSNPHLWGSIPRHLVQEAQLLYLRAKRARRILHCSLGASAVPKCRPPSTANHCMQ